MYVKAAHVLKTNLQQNSEVLSKKDDRMNLSNFPKYHCLPKIHSGVVSYSQFLSLTQVITLLPVRLYPGLQSSSTLVP